MQHLSIYNCEIDSDKLALAQQEVTHFKYAFGDHCLEPLTSISQILQPMLIASTDLSQALGSCSQSTPVIRIVLTDSLLKSATLPLLLAELESIAEQTNTTPIIFDLQIKQTSLIAFLEHPQALNLLVRADLIIADTALIENIRQQTNSSQIATLAHHCQKLSWEFKTNTMQALFSFDSPLPEDLLSDFTQSATLSAAIASFMLLGKRSCDATVLALSYLKQNNFSTPNSQQLTNNQWPTELEHFPQMLTSIKQRVTKAFAQSDTLSLGLYPVVDSIEWLERLLEEGIKTIQLRVKDTAQATLDSYVKRAAELGQQYNARLFINDYWQLAIKHQCYGVHLGQEDLDDTDLAAIQQAGLKLGISTHSEYEWLRAISIKPTYIAMGTVYPTQTKPAILIGLANLRYWCKTLANHYPIVAIGGIKMSNIDPVLDAGAGSIAVVTAITQAQDYKLATRLLVEKQRKQQQF